MNFCQSCWCPCFLLGNITTKLTREKPFTIFSCCPQCAIGSEGCKMCCFTCCLAAGGWPVAPCLSWHVANLRWKLKLFYESDERLKNPTNLKQQCYFYCCWPLSLHEQHQFVAALHREGDLTFQWDFDLYHDQLRRPRKTYPVISVVAIGPQTPSLTLFTTKLLQTASIYHSAVLNEAQQASLLPENRGLELEGIEHISTGLRTLNLYTDNDKNEERDKDKEWKEEKKEPVFLEVWRVPPSRAAQESLLPIVGASPLLLYVLDPSEGLKSLRQVADAFLTHRRLLNARGQAAGIEDRQILILLSGAPEREEEEGDKENSDNNSNEDGEDEGDEEDEFNSGGDSEEDEVDIARYSQRQPFSPSGRPLSTARSRKEKEKEEKEKKKEKKGKGNVDPAVVLSAAQRWLAGEDLDLILGSEEDDEEEGDKKEERREGEGEVEQRGGGERGSGKDLAISTKSKAKGRRKGRDLQLMREEDYRDILRLCLAAAVDATDALDRPLHTANERDWTSVDRGDRGGSSQRSNNNNNVGNSNNRSYRSVGSNHEE